jgi:hypothetical protein
MVLNLNSMSTTQTESFGKVGIITNKQSMRVVDAATMRETPII